jgi:hypothetical protein
MRDNESPKLADEARAHHLYQVRRNEGVAIGQGLDDWQEFAVALRSAVQA